MQILSELSGNTKLVFQTTLNTMLNCIYLMLVFSGPLKAKNYFSCPLKASSTKQYKKSNRI